MEYYKAQNFPFTIRNFLEDDVCDTLTDFIEQKGENYFAPSPVEYWNNRTISFHIIEQEKEIRDLLLYTYKKSSPIINSLSSTTDTLYADTIDLVRWKTGMELLPHIDNAEPDGSPNLTPWRKFSAMIYLNENFEGGEIYWTRIGAQLKPRKGMLVVFPSDAPFQHGVRKVTEGTRYTISSFYGYDKQYDVEMRF